jgi:DNA-directed RNA polymerase subunit beta'
MRAETINYRTLKPEKEGLFCERIFGPTRDFECACGKYKRIRHRGIVCDVCKVEVTRAKVRRERMGHIELAAPVSHIWFFKGTPSRLAHFLDMPPKELERVLYFAESVITWVDVDARERDRDKLQEKVNEQIEALKEEQTDMVAELEGQLTRRRAWFQGASSEGMDDEDYIWKNRFNREEMSKAEVASAIKQLEKEVNRDVQDTESYIEESIDRLQSAWSLFCEALPKQLVDHDGVFRELIASFGSRDGWGEYLGGGMGAEAVRDLINAIDLSDEIEEVGKEIETGKGGQARQTKLAKRLRILHAFVSSGNSPSWMILDVIPVLPPELRPMVQLDGGRFATSDLNDLYRRVINRNNRLRKLIDLGAPDIILANEKRMLQEAVDALFDNGRRGTPVTGSGKRPLKSLADMLKGKQGRFRQNLLGKRVDYSGRSVIVAGPELHLHQCGLPKLMARELFKPFVMSRLVERRIVENIKVAKRRVDDAQDPIVWDILEEVIREHPVLLNRAPTLHRLGIQAFEPVLIEGKAIQVHPLVCHAFNADFDGDQMAVHVPLSPEAQAEARLLMLSSRNILSPAHGAPLAVPSQDMVLGLYYLTYGPEEGDIPSKGLKAYRGESDLARALDRGSLKLSDLISYRPSDYAPEQTTAGRALFHERITTVLKDTVGEGAERYSFINHSLTKREITHLVDRLVELYGPDPLPVVLDELKSLGFHYATRAGITISKNDVTVPSEKPALLAKADSDVAMIEDQFEMGLVSEEERGELIRERWGRATEEVGNAMEKSFDRDNSVWMMANSGARGSMKQIRQLAGMRGLMANPKGETIERPIRSNFLEGLDMLEYFISTHGARKGLADTALRTADSGYMTRRLVDVAQDIVIREADCQSEAGLDLPIWEETQSSLLGRISLASLSTPKGRVVVDKGQLIDREILSDLRDSVEAGTLRVRSPLGCVSKKGICQNCYGIFPATNRLAQIGDAVGIIAAQSIGEPGTQLTMRTFHTGGVAGDDITQGLPRVDELFEAREPKGKALMTVHSGIISIESLDSGARIHIQGEEDSWSVDVPRRVRIMVAKGDKVEPGDQLTEGSLDPHALLRERDAGVVARYLVDEVQRVYRSQGVDINDRHIEVIARQMLRRGEITASGDSLLLPGQVIDMVDLAETTQALEKEGRVGPSWKPLLLGMSRAALATDSFLSAASFQETTRVLTEAALDGKSDHLEGLKENVIIGKLIPAATGMKEWRHLELGHEEIKLGQEVVEGRSREEAPAASRAPAKA